MSGDHRQRDADQRMAATLIARVGIDDRDQLHALGKRNDRSLSAEVRRAIRWYLAVAPSAPALDNQPEAPSR
jgi:hypothetical protein